MQLMRHSLIDHRDLVSCCAPPHLHPSNQVAIPSHQAGAQIDILMALRGPRGQGSYDGMEVARFSVMKVILVLAWLTISVGCRTNEAPEQQVFDAEITAGTKAKLASELGASTVTNISVNVTNGVVTLAGTVHNTDEKAKAVAIANGVNNKVVRVNDNLQVMTTP